MVPDLIAASSVPLHHTSSTLQPTARSLCRILQLAKPPSSFVATTPPVSTSYPKNPPCPVVPFAPVRPSSRSRFLGLLAWAPCREWWPPTVTARAGTAAHTCRCARHGHARHDPASTRSRTAPALAHAHARTAGRRADPCLPDRDLATPVNSHMQSVASPACGVARQPYTGASSHLLLSLPLLAG